MIEGREFAAEMIPPGNSDSARRQQDQAEPERGFEGTAREVEGCSVARVLVCEEGREALDLVEASAALFAFKRIY
jgi:hypothetical protein